MHLLLKRKKIKDSLLLTDKNRASQEYDH